MGTVHSLDEVRRRNRRVDNLELLRVGREHIMPQIREILGRAKVLVLNPDYRPVSVLPPSVLSWDEAMNKISTGDISVAETYDDIAVPSASSAFLLPAVLVRNRASKRKQEVHFSRHNVFMRDAYRCQYCGKDGQGVELNEVDFRIRRRTELTYDHHNPRTKGGKTEWENIVTACTACNSEKGSRTNFRRPLRLPRKPTYSELAAFAIRQPISIPCEKWAPYLGWKGPIYVHTPLDDQYALVDDGFGNYTRGDTTRTDESSV